MQTFKYVLVAVVVVVAGALLATSAHAAWSGPLGVPPPTGPNVAPPLNVSGAGQEKLGGLTLGLQLFNPFAANAANCPPGIRSTVSNCSQGFFSSGPTFRPISGNDALGADGFGLKVVNGRVLSFGSVNPYDPDGAGFCLAGINHPLRCLTWNDFDWLYNSGHGSSGGTTVNVRQSSDTTIFNNSTSTTNRYSNICTAGQVSTAANPCITLPPSLWTLLSNGKLGNTNTNNGIDVTGKVTTLGPNKGFCIGTHCINDWPDLRSFNVGIQKLNAGTGVTLSPNPITADSPNGEGTITANVKEILSGAGVCAEGTVLQGINDTAGSADFGKPVCVPKVQCTGTNCPVPPTDIGPGTPGYLPLWKGANKIGDSLAHQAGRSIVVGTDQASDNSYSLQAIAVGDQSNKNGVLGQTNFSGTGIKGYNSASGTGVEGYSTTGRGGLFRTDTGVALMTKGRLRLTNIGEGGDIPKVLAGDGNGVAQWKTLKELGGGDTSVDALWEKIGTTENIHNKNTGSIGIGTDNPQAKLDVVGPVRITKDGNTTSAFVSPPGYDAPGPGPMTESADIKVYDLPANHKATRIFTDGTILFTAGTASNDNAVPWLPFVAAYAVRSPMSPLMTGIWQDHPVDKTAPRRLSNELTKGGYIYVRTRLATEVAPNTGSERCWKMSQSTQPEITATVVPCRGVAQPIVGLVSEDTNSASMTDSGTVVIGSYRYSLINKTSDGWGAIKIESVSTAVSGGVKRELAVSTPSLMAATFWLVDAIKGIFSGVTGGGSSSDAPVLLSVDGKVRIADGSQGNNKVLAADNNGVATWKSKDELGLGGASCTISGNTITCGGNTLTIPTGACTIAGNTITCGGQSLTLTTKLASYNDLPAGSMAGYGIVEANFQGPQNSTIIPPVTRPAVPSGQSLSCESGWKPVTLGSNPGSSALVGNQGGAAYYSCIKL